MSLKNVRISAEGVPEVSPEETLAASSAGGSPTVELIDVRRPDEFNAELGHVPGAKLVTLETDFMNWLATAPADRTYVFLCRSGARSGRATLLARSKGLKESYNMEGGMILWNSRGLKVERN